MKVEIRNLGAVEHAEIDLKPLTIFIGPNNTGKTWTAYALSFILGPDGYNLYSRAYAADEVQETYPPLETAIQEVLNKGTAKFDLVQFADEYGEAYLDDVARLARGRMPGYLGAKRVSFDDLEIGVRLGAERQQFLECVRAYETRGELAPGSEGALLTALKEKNDPVLYFYTTKERTLSEELPLRAIRSFLAGGVFMALHSTIYSYVYPLPTERTTFITFPFTIPEESPEIVEAPPQERRITLLSRPVGKFLNLVSDAYQCSWADREKAARKNPAVQSYIEMAELLEKDVLGGSLDFSSPEPGPHREILYQPGEGIVLGMTEASSMVKELAPLVLFLRYLVDPGELLVIDEPEMNLHPEAQARLVEFLAMLVRHNLRVLITTHSPYMVDHLVNLMEAAEHKDKAAIRDMFFLKQKDAFISRDQVSVYLFQDGTARSILDEEGVIDWGTFARTSDQIHQMFFDLQGDD